MTNEDIYAMLIEPLYLYKEVVVVELFLRRPKDYSERPDLITLWDPPFEVTIGKIDPFGKFLTLSKTAGLEYEICQVVDSLKIVVTLERKEVGKIAVQGEDCVIEFLKNEIKISGHITYVQIIDPSN